MTLSDLPAVAAEVFGLPVEDSPYDAELSYRELPNGGRPFRSRRAETPGLLLCDYSRPTFDGLAALRLEVPVIFGNQKFNQSLGRPAVEILGQSNAAFFPPELAADDLAVIAADRPSERLDEQLQQSQKMAAVGQLASGVPAPTPVKETATTTHPPPGSSTILVVDDEATVRRLVALILRHSGYQVFEANSGPHALAVWESVGKVDLLLTDMVMPGGVSGRELAAQFQTRQPSLKVIYMSGYPEEFERADFVLRNRSRFMAKPFRVEVMLQAVQQSLAPPPTAPAA